MSPKSSTIKHSQQAIRIKISTQCLWITLKSNRICRVSLGDSPHLKYASSNNNTRLTNQISNLNSIAIRAISTRQQGLQIMIYDNSMHTRVQQRTKIHTLDKFVICKLHLKVHSSSSNSRESSPSHLPTSRQDAARQNSWNDLRRKWHPRLLQEASRNTIKINLPAQLIKWKLMRPTLQYFIQNNSRHKFKRVTARKTILPISWGILGMTCLGAWPQVKVELKLIMGHQMAPMMLRSEKWRHYSQKLAKMSQN